MNQKARRRLAGLTAGLSTSLVALLASATPAAVIKLQDGTEAGPQETDGGPGAEQASVTSVMRDGKVYIVTVWMSSKVPEEQRNWQCKCTSLELSADGTPTVVADQVTLGPYDGGDRLCNHPKLASDGQNVLWTYGSDKNDSGNVRTYVGVLDHMCQETAEQIRISDDNGNNEGAPDIASNGDGYFTAGYLSTNNNDRSVAVGVHLSTDGGTNLLELMWRESIVAPSNIGRPAIGGMGPTRTLFCASKGDNRPPEDGVECAVLDAMTGERKTHSLIAPSQPEEHVYMNQPSVAQLDFGRWAVMALESSGEGKTDNIKGSNTSHIYVTEPTDDGISVRANETGLGSFQTHSAICGGAYGEAETENRVIGIFGAPVTGNGPPVLQVARYEANTGVTADVDNEKWIAGYYADSGKLANLYGHNPQTQGRDFLRCIGDVPNPAFGNEAGFFPSVKSFFVIPHQGRTPGEEKNSQWLALIPGATVRPLPPGPPEDLGGIDLGYEGEKVPTGPGPSGSGAGSGDGDGDGNGDGDGDGDGTGQGGAGVGPSGTGANAANGDKPPSAGTSGCACEVGAPNRDGSNNAALVIAMGLATALISRRRKEG